MRHSLASGQDRARSALLVAAIHVALGYALLSGMGVAPSPAELKPPLALLDLTEEPEPPAEPMQPEAAPKPTDKPKDPEGAAAPPALKNTPTEVVAPPPAVKLPIPPPLPAAPLPGTGAAANPGAAPIPGPGTGRGGVGDGLGSGQSGDGAGGGGGGGYANLAEYRSGQIDLRDVPPTILARNPQGLVRFSLLIEPDGRASDCRITRSSGYRDLDRATCAAAVRRLRYFPARDRSGRPFASWAPGEQEWFMRPGQDRWIDPIEVRD